MFDALLVKPIVNLLIGIYAALPIHDMGLAIIIVTLIIRFLLWPLAAKGLHSQRALQKLQPEVNAIRKKAKTKQEESKMIMELYKEKEINPFSSCLLTLVQLPLLIALFIAFERGIKIDNMIALLYPWVQNLDYVKTIMADHSKFQVSLFGLVDLLKPSIILGIIAGALQFVQTKMITPAHVDDDNPQGRATKQMMYFLPIITVVFAFKLPAALPLYWIVTTLVAIFQQWLILSKDVERAEKGNG